MAFDMVAYQRDYYARNKTILQERAAARYADNRAEMQARRRAYRQRLRQQCLAGYGSRCACCGEDNPGFLSLDHVNGGGGAHRKLVGSAYMVMLAAIKAGFPDDYQVLCYNCNLGRQANGGVCPHQGDDAR